MKKPPRDSHRTRRRPVALVGCAFALCACAGAPADPIAETAALVRAHGIDVSSNADPAPSASADSNVPADKALSLDDAVRTAFAHNGRVQLAWARLGLAEADLQSALRPPNPRLGYAHLDSTRGGAQITGSIVADVTNLLLLPLRARFARGEFERTQANVASTLMQLASDVEVAWFDAIAAQQIAHVHARIARAADASATLAQRFFDAGNITQLQLAREQAAAAQARIDATRADIAALQARAALAQQLGIPAHDTWHVADSLPLPPTTAYDADALVAQARVQRLDLIAAQQAQTQRADALASTRAWRWLGGLEFGYDHEREVDGGALRGPTLALELPLFDQGQAAIARGDASLREATADATLLGLAVQNDVRIDVEHTLLARDIADRYRKLLVPAREDIVERMQERVNYMLAGAFELLAARADADNTYVAYVEAVHAFWVARARLRAAAGGQLPDDSAVATLTATPSAPEPEPIPAHHHDGAAP